MSTAPDRPAPPGYMARFRDPAARNYLFIGLSALLVIAAVFFSRGGFLAAALPTAVAAAAMLTRSPSLPGLFLVLVGYFLVLPFGLPLGRSFVGEIAQSHFRIEDVILTGAVLTYLACQCRLLSLVQQGLPPDVPPHLRTKADRPVRRPGSIVGPDETARMFAVLGGCVLAGQVVWLLVSELRLDLAHFPPLQLPGTADYRGRRAAGDASEPLTRFLLLAGLLAGVMIPAGLVFWYWRLSRLDPAEARMVLLDTSWREARRELNRQEKWRAWGATRATRKRWRPRLGLLARVVLIGFGILGVIVVFWLAVLWFVVLRRM